MPCTPSLWLGLQRTHCQLKDGDTMNEARWKDVETKEKSILQSLTSQPCVKRAYSLVQQILLILTVPKLSLWLSG